MQLFLRDVIKNRVATVYVEWDSMTETHETFIDRLWVQLESQGIDEKAVRIMVRGVELRRDDKKMTSSELLGHAKNGNFIMIPRPDTTKVTTEKRSYEVRYSFQRPSSIVLRTPRGSLEVDMVPDYYTGEIDVFREISHALKTTAVHGFDSSKQYFQVVVAGKRMNREDYNRHINNGMHTKENHAGTIVFSDTIVEAKINDHSETVQIKRSSNGKWALISSLSLFIVSKNLTPLF